MLAVLTILTVLTVLAVLTVFAVIIVFFAKGMTHSTKTVKQEMLAHLKIIYCLESKFKMKTIHESYFEEIFTFSFHIEHFKTCLSRQRYSEETPLTLPFPPLHYSFQNAPPNPSIPSTLKSA